MTTEEEAPPTLFPAAETLKLVSSLISWEEDTARSLRVKVDHWLGYIIPFFLPIMLFFYAHRFHLLCFAKVPIILMLLAYYAQ